MRTLTKLECDLDNWFTDFQGERIRQLSLEVAREAVFFVITEQFWNEAKSKGSNARLFDQIQKIPGAVTGQVEYDKVSGDTFDNQIQRLDEDGALCTFLAQVGISKGSFIPRQPTQNASRDEIFESLFSSYLPFLQAVTIYDSWGCHNLLNPESGISWLLEKKLFAIPELKIKLYSHMPRQEFDSQFGYSDRKYKSVGEQCILFQPAINRLGRQKRRANLHILPVTKLSHDRHIMLKFEFGKIAISVGKGAEIFSGEQTNNFMTVSEIRTADADKRVTQAESDRVISQNRKLSFDFTTR